LSECNHHPTVNARLEAPFVLTVEDLEDVWMAGAKAAVEAAQKRTENAVTVNFILVV
jgi:hypothetical protein